MEYSIQIRRIIAATAAVIQKKKEKENEQHGLNSDGYSRKAPHERQNVCQQEHENTQTTMPFWSFHKGHFHRHGGVCESLATRQE